MSLARSAPAQNFYHVTDLGVLPGTNASSEAYAINESGQVVGESTGTVAGVGRTGAFLWTSAGGMQDLGSVPGGDPNRALAINDNGQVVGQSHPRAFLWTSGGGMQDLGTLPGDFYSSAMGINDSGQVVGVTGSTESQAFLWTSAGGMQGLGALPGGNFSRASGINSSGQVVGTSGTATDERAFFWTSGGGMQDLGFIAGGSDFSGAEAINDSGQVVGFSRVPGGNNHAFLWTSAGGMRDLGILPGGQEQSHAHAINNRGQVVGGASASGGQPRAFIWTDVAGMRDLNGLLDGSGAGWTLIGGFGINDAGKIAAVGENPSGVRHGFLLTPIGPLVAFTEFNEPAIGASMYAPGAIGEELGFGTTTSATGGLNPLAGVAALGDGSVRLFSHRSINATTTLDAVDLTPYDDVIVSLRLQVANTTYEAGDLARAYVTDGTQTIDLFNLAGTAAAGDPLDNLAGDGFLGYSVLLPNSWTQATLVITSSSNSSQAAERYDFDSIEFRAIPEPGTLSLVFITLLFAVARIRRMGPANL